MRMMGAEVRPVTSGSRTLRDAINEAMRDWMSSVETTHYILGSVVGPHPFPVIVRDFQSVIGRETIEQCLAQLGRLPDLVVACVGGGSNSAGMFYPFVEHTERRAAGRRGGRASVEAGRSCRAPVVRLARRAARQLQLRDAGRRRPDERRPFDLGRARLPRRRARAQLLERDRAASATPSPATTRRWPRSTRWPAAKESCRRWRARTPSPRRSKRRRRRPQGSGRRGLPVGPRRQRRLRNRAAARRTIA